MHVVVRNYAHEGSSELFDAMDQHQEDVKKLIAGVPGFVSYATFRSGDGVMSVTACQDKAGTDESSNRAAAWIKDNVSASVAPPEVTEGSTFLQF